MSNTFSTNVVQFEPTPQSSCRIAFGIDQHGRLSFRDEEVADTAQKFFLYSLAQDFLETELRNMKAKSMQKITRPP